MGHEKGRGAAQRITALLLALAVWELAVRIVDNRLLLVGPIATVKCLISLMSESAFWLAALSSSGRIMLGFALALLTALPLSALAAQAEELPAAAHLVYITNDTVPDTAAQTALRRFGTLSILYCGDEPTTDGVHFDAVQYARQLETLTI